MKSCAINAPTPSGAVTAALNRHRWTLPLGVRNIKFAERTHLGKITTTCKPKRNAKHMRRFGAQNEPILTLTKFPRIADLSVEASTKVAASRVKAKRRRVTILLIPCHVDLSVEVSAKTEALAKTGHTPVQSSIKAYSRLFKPAQIHSRVF